MTVRTEAEILHTKSDNLEKAFIDLFGLYANDIYRFCFSLLYYHTHLAEADVRYVFEKAHKYFHAFVPGQVSYRSYLFSLAVTQLQRDRKTITQTAHGLPKSIRRKFSKSECHLWEALQRLDSTYLVVVELWYGAQLSINEISVVINQDVHSVQQLHDAALYQLQSILPCTQANLINLFTRRAKKLGLSKSAIVRLQREVTEGRKPSPTFVRRAWWQMLLGPMPAGFVLGIVVVTGAAVWYVYKPAPLQVPEVTQISVITTPAAEQRPQAVLISGTLPATQLAKRSLTTAETSLFGTSYPVDDTSTIPDETKLEPIISVDLPVNEYRQISQAYIYNVPQALDEDDLQLKAFNHFFSLPLNQFTYVNGTYYIEDSATEFRPLFIAFNNDGSVEFQMRQAAICQLEGLTDTYTDDEVRTMAYDFLRAHHFVEVDEKDLKIIRTSEDGRSIKRDAICKDGSEAPVQDRTFAFYQSHITVRYGETAEDTLPMRLRGIAVQTHAHDVTSMRLDRLQMLREHMVRTSTAEVVPLNKAIEELKKFYYPASAERDQYQRYVKSFAQWDHLHGEARLTSIDITNVALEYVFDPLNYRIEPYYVFTGSGDSAQGHDSEVRIYVVATTEEIELRGPYRE